MMNAFVYKTLLLVLILSASSCSTISSNEKILPNAIGKEGGIVLVAEENLWQDTSVKLIKQILLKSPGGLPKAESLFKITTTPPRTYFKTLNKYKTILIPIIINHRGSQFDHFTEGLDANTLRQVQEKGVLLKKAVDKYAIGQNIVYLIASDKNALLSYLNENAIQFKSYFHKLEIQGLLKKVRKEKVNQKAINLIQEKFSGKMTIPKRFVLAMDSVGFIWLRQAESEKDLNIMITSFNSVSPSFLPKRIIEFRDFICKRYIYGSSDKDSYMHTETIIPPTFNDVNFNKVYAKECRGLWKLKNLSMGGTFISYTMIHPNTKKQLYLEAFINNPGKKKIPELRKLEAILKTFSF